MARPPWLTVPNAITLFRLGMVPAFLAFHLQGKPDWALGCFGVAAVSDALDGLLARLLNQRSKLGAILDPVADKALVVAALLSLVVEHRVPAWLLILILLRDGYMLLLALVVRQKHLEVAVQPTRVGKYATASLTVLVVLALVDQVVGSGALLHAYTEVFGLTSGLCVVISTLQYLARFSYLLAAPARAPP